VNYNELTDFEINKLVAEKLGGTDCEQMHGSRSDYVLFKEDLPYYSIKEADYCNNPSDAWPIILENRIEIHPREIIMIGGEMEVWGARQGFDDSWESLVVNENPLRAAMICFLMMGDK